MHQPYALPGRASLPAWPLVVMLLALVAPAAAQQEAVGGAVTFGGLVVDTYWGEPVPDALVAFEGTIRLDGSQIWGVTNEEGRFSIPNVPPGPSQVTVSRIGYADLTQVIDVREGQLIEVALIPKPVVLEGIEVYVDRLDGRLRELPYVTTTFDEISLRLSPNLNVAQYLESQPRFEFVPCFENDSGTGAFRQRRDCMRTRGTLTQRPRIFIDDAPAFGGIPELASLPTGDIYRIDVIRGCGQIRVYTRHYVEGVAERPIALVPIIC